jgi:hypothetical protein
MEVTMNALKQRRKLEEREGHTLLGGRQFPAPELVEVPQTAQDIAQAEKTQKEAQSEQ